MPDPVTEELLGKLKIMAEKNGIEFDPNRMTTDMGYAYEILWNWVIRMTRYRAWSSCRC